MSVHDKHPHDLGGTATGAPGCRCPWVTNIPAQMSMRSEVGPARSLCILSIWRELVKWGTEEKHMLSGENSFRLKYIDVWHVYVINTLMFFS